MDYLKAAQALQEDGALAEATRSRLLAAANINPATGLASDYLNHFNEAIMLLELLPSSPDCRDEFLNWRARSYTEHFAHSQSRHRDLAISAYASADTQARERLEVLSGTMTVMLEATRAALAGELPPEAAVALAERVATALRPLIARAGAVVNGDDDNGRPPAPQAMVDALMR